MAGMSPVSRGFHRRHQDPAETAGRVPPGQYLTKDFPVLSAGPTPHTAVDHWSFSVGRSGQQKTWSWAEFRALPSQDVTVDIHCVTKWSKLDTAWQGVSVDKLLDLAGHDGPFAMAHCDGGYTTNLPVADLTGGKAWVAYAYDGQPTPASPANLPPAPTDSASSPWPPNTSTWSSPPAKPAHARSRPC
jgi:DMSO/TMAO reductase YedYZ molybdopterin-dependent catalytic subunit